MHAELASTRFTRKSTDIRIRGGILRGIMVSSFLLRSAPAYTEKSAVAANAGRGWNRFRNMFLPTFGVPPLGGFGVWSSAFRRPGARGNSTSDQADPFPEH